MLNFYLKVLDNESNINIRQYVCFAISNILACDSVIIKQTMNHAIFNHPIWRDPNEDYQVNIEFIHILYKLSENFQFFFNYLLQIFIRLKRN